jgi:dolichol-phosphate mannosyltransferase
VSDLSRVLVTLCTYNERGNLAELVAEIHRFVPAADVVVVDDNSPDGTGPLADELASRDPRVHVLHRPAKAGLGRATVAAFRWGIDRGYDRLVNMDADFSHPPRFLPDLLALADQSDVVIASRYVAGGGVVGWSLLRHLMSRGINAYARLMLRLRTRDNSGSYRCYSVARLRELPLDAVRAAGYAIQEEILYHCRRAGCTFAEVPFTFEERRHGESKINWREAVTALWVLFRLGVFGPSTSGK